MAFNLGDIIVTIKAKTDDLKKGMAEVEGMANATKSFSDKATAYMEASTKASKKFAIGAAAAGAVVAGFGVTSVKAFSDSEDRIAQTNAVLKSTANIAGVSADSVRNLASALERQTKFSDEDVRSVENLLLTFTSIGKDIFPQATSTVLDMATALGEDTSSASIQLGKALQDPVLGITALRRVGVNFNDDQKKVIENLVETGHKAEAQKAILAELNKEFGGSAKAAGDTYAGTLAKLKNQFNNLQEQVGGTILTALKPFVDWMGRVISQVQAAGGLLVVINTFWAKHKNEIVAVVGAIVGALLPALGLMIFNFAKMLLVLSPWMILGVAIALIILHWHDITKTFKGTVEALQRAWDAVYGSIKRVVDAVGSTIWVWLKDRVNDVKDAFDLLFKTAEQIFKKITDFIERHKKAITDWSIVITAILLPKIVLIGTQFAISAGQAIASFVAMAASAVANALVASAAWVASAAATVFVWATTTLPRIIFGLLLTSGQAIVSAAIMTASFIASSVATLASWTITFATYLAGIALMAAQTLIAGARMAFGFALALGPIGLLIAVVIGAAALIIANWDAVRGFVMRVWDDIRSGAVNAFNAVVSWLGGLPKRIRDAVGNLGSILYDAGKSVIDGLIKGIKDKFGDVKDTLHNLTNKLTSWKGPQDVDKNILFGAGRLVIGGFIDGLTSVYPAVQQSLGELTNHLSGMAMTGPAMAGSVDNSSRTTSIGQVVINNRQDADYLLTMLDHNQQLESMGMSPSR